MTPPAESLAALLQVDDGELAAGWARLESWARGRFHRETSVESALFLVGIQARGRGFTERLPKEEKQDLIMLGTWKVMEHAGLAVLDEMDGRWERTIPLPVLDKESQEKLLRAALVRYFAAHIEGGPQPDSVR